MKVFSFESKTIGFFHAKRRYQLLEREKKVPDCLP